MNQHEHSISHPERPSSCSDRTLNPLPHHLHCASSPYLQTLRPTHTYHPTSKLHAKSKQSPSPHALALTPTPPNPQQQTIALSISTATTHVAPSPDGSPHMHNTVVLCALPAETPDTYTHHASFLHPPCPRVTIPTRFFSYIDYIQSTSVR